jgi:hypothetical protein
MKNAWYASLSLMFLFSACSSERYVVESDYSYKSDFKKYKFFSVINRVATEKDSSMANLMVSREIEDRMKLQGYKSTQKKPNLLVFHKIYYDDLLFQGFRQPDMEAWVKEQVNEEDDAKYDPTKYDLRKGTLLIQMVDSKNHQVVWQGYASGLFTENATRNERYLKRAVRSIFDQYRAFAEGYILEQKARESSDMN